MKVIIISDNPNHPGQHKLVESLRRHGWDYVEIVEPFRGLGYKISELAKYLRKSGDKEFILMDAFDTYCIAPPSEWERYVYPFSADIVISGEKQCFPHPEKAEFFLGRSPWKFPNSGQRWGRSQPFLDLVDVFEWNDADNDQIWYMIAQPGDRYSSMCNVSISNPLHSRRRAISHSCTIDCRTM